MKTISLTDRIKLIHCDGDDAGGHGVLILTDYTGRPTQVLSYETQAEFKLHYHNLSVMETTQDELTKELVMA